MHTRMQSTGSGSDLSDPEGRLRQQPPKEELPTLKVANEQHLSLLVPTLTVCASRQELLEHGDLPRCRQLLDTFRACPNTQNKTPLAILHEYSSRFNLEVRWLCSSMCSTPQS